MPPSLRCHWRQVNCASSQYLLTVHVQRQRTATYSKMSVAFWSVDIKKGKPQEVQPPEGYVLNVQQAALVGDGPVIVRAKSTSIEGDVLNPVLCTLKSQFPQTNLQLVFGFDVPIEFTAEGNGTVSLSGYFQPGPESFSDDDDDDLDMYDLDDDEEDAVVGKAIAHKNMIQNGGGKKDGESTSDDDDDDDDEDDEMDVDN